MRLRELNEDDPEKAMYVSCNSGLSFINLLIFFIRETEI